MKRVLAFLVGISLCASTVSAGQKPIKGKVKGESCISAYLYLDGTNDAAIALVTLPVFVPSVGTYSCLDIDPPESMTVGECSAVLHKQEPVFMQNVFWAQFVTWQQVWRVPASCLGDGPEVVGSFGEGISFKFKKGGK